MTLKVVSRVLPLAIVVLGAAALSCGSISTLSDASAPGAAGSSAGGNTGSGGSAGTGMGGTTGAAGSGNAGGGMGGGGGVRIDGGVDAAPLACHIDLNDCPTGSTCGCGGPGPGVCTCHKNCTDSNACPLAEPMCGCPSTTGGARFCVNACFCSCQ